MIHVNKIRAAKYAVILAGIFGAMSLINYITYFQALSLGKAGCFSCRDGAYIPLNWSVLFALPAVIIGLVSLILVLSVRMSFSMMSLKKEK